MKTEPTPFFLFLGDSDREGATSKLQAAGWEYKKKRLESSTENWRTILEIIKTENPVGILAKFTAQTYKVITQPQHGSVLKTLFSLMRDRSHVIFIHESVFSGKVERNAIDDAAEDDEYFYSPSGYFEPPPTEIREAINRLMEEYDLNAVVYKRNAEMTVMASSFIDQNERNLIFRIYVPVGRLWAKEAEKVLHLFRDYLSKVSGLKVRQDQYSTNQGVVYELFGDHALDPALIPREFSEFSEFMAVCVADPVKASILLATKQVDQRVISEIVDRYSIEARRLQVDLRQDRERKVLSIRHRMESELVDVVGGQMRPEELQSFIDSVVPPLDGFSAPLHLTSNATIAGGAQNVTLNFKPQFIASVKGIVAQEVSGTQNFGVEVDQLIELIRLHGGKQADALTSAVYEFEDPDAKHENRLSAKQKLASFLIKAGGKVGDIALGVLQSYIESKMEL
jgi:hypothetical protein